MNLTIRAMMFKISFLMADPLRQSGKEARRRNKPVRQLFNTCRAQNHNQVLNRELARRSSNFDTHDYGFQEDDPVFFHVLLISTNSKHKSSTHRKQDIRGRHEIPIQVCILLIRRAQIHTNIFCRGFNHQSTIEFQHADPLISQEGDMPVQSIS